ncbi:MAG: hypothetical protein ABSG41_01440 [Bryobacteraceae bacterium]|jgi:hypothetical protein
MLKIDHGKAAVISRAAERLLLKIGDHRTGTRIRDPLERTVLQIVDAIASSPSESLAYPCCLRSLPCPYGGCQKIGEILAASIESSAAAGYVRQDVDASLAVWFFPYLLSAAVNHNNGGDQLRRNLAAAAQFWLDGIRRRVNEGSS